MFFVAAIDGLVLGYGVAILNGWTDAPSYRFIAWYLIVDGVLSILTCCGRADE